MNATEMEDFENICKLLKGAAQRLALATGEERNCDLALVALSVKNHTEDILRANALDVEAARGRGTSESLIDRLSLNEKKIEGMVSSVSSIISQGDPIGEGKTWRAPNGMTIRQVAVPLGVVAVIYESRPNVTLDTFALCRKSGNAVLLRGSQGAYRSNCAIVEAIKEGLLEAQARHAKNMLDTSSSHGAYGENGVFLMPPLDDHADVDMILNARGLIDVAIPRGGKKLIAHVVQNARVPTIETGSGICHLYVDEDADLDMAADIARNGKMSRPGVCNAIECILVHRDRLQDFLPLLAKTFGDKVQLRADAQCYPLLCASGGNVVYAAPEDWDTEFLGLVCAVHAVGSIDEAIDFINQHGTGHSECIVTEGLPRARLFQARVDAACVYVNASTRFTDGGEFGFGAELGISTQKLHARGPMGADTLTTTKYLIDGNGQVRE